MILYSLKLINTHENNTRLTYRKPQYGLTELQINRNTILSEIMV